MISLAESIELECTADDDFGLRGGGTGVGSVIGGSWECHKNM